MSGTEVWIRSAVGKSYQRNSDELAGLRDLLEVWSVRMFGATVITKKLL